jgi:succinate-semialdehyde dehydrogenase / glutarate-semialdehyde dehydrogenase
MTHTITLEERLVSSEGVYIGGEWLSGNDGTFDVENPADGSIVGVVANADLSQATRAVDAAACAAEAWQDVSPRGRSDVLMRTFQLMLDNAEYLSFLISQENGKSIADARAEVAYAAEFFRWYAEEGVRAGGDYGSSPAGGVRTVVTHRPVGVAALVTPWNFPAAMATRKIAPALAAGCTVVLKPARETPLTAVAIARLLEQAGLPAGVVNVVPSLRSADVVRTWLEDPRVRKLSFTGSTDVGRVLLAQAANRVLNTSMELGGNAPFIVTQDADVESAVSGAMIAKFRGGGQACTAANRFYVHEDVAFEFVARMSERVNRLVVGPASHPDTEIGPMISRRAVDTISDLVSDALERGARRAAVAPVPTDLAGHYMAPTLLADVPPDARVVQEEIFGPVAPVVTWRSEDQLLSMVNGTEMGLAAYLYSNDLKRAMQLAEKVDSGMVGINRGLVSDPSAPFGGMKQSGLGREGARDGLAEYRETQYFSVDWSA